MQKDGIETLARFDFIATYMLANRKNGAIYTGSTSDLGARMDQHKAGRGKWQPQYKIGCMVQRSSRQP